MSKENFKIACIFSKDRMENAIGGDNYNLPFCKEYIRKTQKYLFISQSGAFFDEPNEEWDIVLIWDGYDGEEKVGNVDFTDVAVFNKDTTLLMYHDKPDKLLTLDSAKVRKPKEGHHENDENLGYTLLNYLIKEWDATATSPKFKQPGYDQAKEKLIKWFGLNEKLNKALGFLHGSIGGKPASTSILTNGDEVFDLSLKYKKDKVEKEIEKWIKDLQWKKDDEYNIALAIVRDALLEQAGVTGEN